MVSWMKQQTQKLRRQRRAWAKQYNKPSGIIPNKGVIVEYKDRVKNLGANEAEIDALIMKTYGHGPWKGVPAGKAEIMKVLKELKKKVPELHYICVADNAYHRIRIYYGSGGAYLIKDDHRRMVIQTSRTYKDIGHAKFAYEADLVGWETTTQVAPP
jgi:hypothetical protein